MKKPPIIVITGPTASGKSTLAIELARSIGAEIVSADSRQVYRGMDLGTGKVTKEEQRLARHHLIDIANPKVEYNVSHFLTDAMKAILDIESRGKRVIICGGTAFWIEALMLGLPLPKVVPDPAFREKWGQKDVGELYGYLKRLDPERAKTIDRKNKVRLLRAIEITRTLGKVPKIDRTTLPDLSRYIVIGINPPVDELNRKIRERFMDRMKAGMLEEAVRLNRAGLSYERLESFGLEYRALAEYLQKKITDTELYTELPQAIIHYAKRQRSSLRRLEKQGVKIHWIKDASEALAIVK
ncbi:MAG: tRNA (adenosine(37)-N6)-dimethylallyltransferase MiaA [Candidatus Moraniibacteriota bacterium]|nr:MAG: tRNA (adenosine(37)-N6)-dimethylallyltransferase MiaA [Candidatus Moranbacteria bacterium]